jgi:hypothetical protein
VRSSARLIGDKPSKPADQFVTTTLVDPAFAWASTATCREQRQPAGEAVSAALQVGATPRAGYSQLAAYAPTIKR